MDREHQLLHQLIKAVTIIRQWHGKEAFEIYYNMSPDMKSIRQLVTPDYEHFLILENSLRENGLI